MTLQIGDPAPDFNLLDQEGCCTSLSSFLGNRVVIYFYPKDDTPGCTIEVCGFRDKYDLFKILGAEVWGVSNANAKSHRMFAEKNKLPFPLLCDETNSLRKAFGVPKFLGILDGRVTFIIDSEGIIRHVFNDNLNTSAHITEALRVLDEIRM